MDQALSEFVADGREGLSRLEAGLMAVESGAAPDIAALFRVVHTIKGTAGFFALPRVERVSHAAEEYLGRVRDGSARLGPDGVAALLAVVDAHRGLLLDVERTGREADHDPARALAALSALRTGGAAAAEPPALERAAERTAEVDGRVRIDVTLLDRLMNLVGELVLVRNQTLRLASELQDPRLHAPLQRLDLVAAELQRGVMKTRMRPVADAWAPLPRLAREVGRACGKQVRLETSGEATELDRTLLDAIRDPLTHLVRNAVDHGLERPEVRLARGKPAEGRVLLRARHEGGTVVIEVADDGAGVDLERVRLAAVRSGRLTAELAAAAPPAELVALLFAPGFSTAEAVTTVSGRGVGLDVVRANLDRVGGAVELQAEPGQGTTVRMKIPLTLAIIPALVVADDGARYLLPQGDVVELVRVEDRAALERVLEAPVLRLRGQLLTLLELDRALAGPRARGAAACHVVVLRAEARAFGLVVDEVLETEEIVVKPLPGLVAEAGPYAGATILGDGEVALILDALGLARRANLLARRGPAAAPAATPSRAAEALLLVEVCGGERAAVPLSAVARLEELDPARIERSGGGLVVQYRGEIVPLVDVSAALGRPAPAREGAVPVVVHAGPGGSTGLVVERIVDVVEEPLAGRRRSTRTRVLATGILQQRVTDLLDVAALVGAPSEGEVA